MYIVAFFIGFLFWKSCKFWRRLRALDYIWKSGVGFTLFYFTNLFVEILGRKGSGTMIFIVSWCYGGLAMVIFILFWQGSYPPWWHHTGIYMAETKPLRGNLRGNGGRNGEVFWTRFGCRKRIGLPWAVGRWCFAKWRVSKLSRPSARRITWRIVLVVCFSGVFAIIACGQ